ncbi:DUF3817 domain-containing protein [Christiangramia sp. SM2212]|uniref:DUF3817 domain-containing protein n=1 Tax=Christiangramia sediminicola TaxID=3073267 RepID=A0ABU1EQ82_9FLAO|nr:DUF3817 domain-containing protein [Christiangramia sp. SM2212]MDR5590177.1 DUF3817 domain-containing protein [Christiangramia sp. SM2212]
MSLKSKVKLFKWISILEGTSFLLLLFIAMPLKYLYNMPQMVQQVGMAHGILFIAYVLGGVILWKPMNWTLAQMGIILGCSVLPFGPFFVEKKYL